MFKIRPLRKVIAHKKLRMTIQSNKLELYLNDVYVKECAFEIEEAETKFIKTGIETLVNKIATKILGDEKLQDNMTKTFEKYFEGKLMRSPIDIVGAGSFYEGTKNKFPDEFDFILILYSCEGTPQQFKQYLLEASLFNTVTDTFTAVVKDTVEKNKQDLKFISAGNLRKAKLYFQKHLRFHGPATWLRFTYENERRQTREIDVDFVAALKIGDGKMLEHAVKESCALTEFSQEVLSAGSCFCIGANYSFTPTEVHIMKNMLSENHRKIYRILKFLINGHGDVENITTSLGGYEKPYSSFMVKTLMIYHHYRCRTSDNGHLGPCLLEILEEMCKYKTSSEFPSLFKTDNRTRLICDLVLVNHVQSLIERLKSLQKVSGIAYNYEKDKIKHSVSKMYDDDKHERMSGVKGTCP